MSGALPLGVVLAGARARRAVLAPFGAVVSVVTAPLVAGLSLTDVRTTLQVCAPLLVLAVASLPELGAELAAARRTETGVATVRGLRGAGLARWLLPEPVFVLALGAAIGALLGVVLGHGLGGSPGARYSTPSWRELATLLLPVLLVLLGAVLVGSLAASRRPLVEQISPVVRRRPGASPVRLLLGLLVVAATLLAAYRALTGADAASDWAVAAGPGVLGLTAGVVAVAAVRLLATLLRSATRGAALAPWLTSRILSHGAGRGVATRLCVAGLVIAGLALGQAQATSRWLDDTARVGNGAALRIPYDGGAINALQLTRRIDPAGRWLMAGQLLVDGSEPSRRVVQLDTSRYDRVAAPMLEGTAAADAAHRLAALRSGPPVRIGTAATVTVSGQVRRGATAPVRPVGVRLDYVNGTGGLASAQLDVRPGADGTFRLHAAALRSCSDGCALTGLGLSENGPGRVELTLTRLEVAGHAQLALPWSVEPAVGARPNELSTAGHELAVTFGDGAELTVGDAAAGLPILATPDVRFDDGQGVATVGGVTRTPRSVGTVASLPLVESSGVLEDLAVAALGAAPSPPVAEVFILARADTPDVVLARVPGSDSAARTVDRARSVAAGHAETYRAWLCALAGLAALLVALLVVAADAARHHHERRQARESLRLARVPVATTARAQRAALALTAATALVVTVAGVLAAWWLFFDALTLLHLSSSALPLTWGVPW